MRIAVVGLGKIGLPLAVQFASKDNDVVGVDVEAHVVEEVNHGRAPFPGEPGLASLLTTTVGGGRLRATTEYRIALEAADVAVVVVPLYVDQNTGEPDFRWMDAATESLGENLRPGTLVVYETTLPVGTTRERWKPALERLSGYREGEDFHVVFSPERVLTGRIFADLRKYPKLIGAFSIAGAERARRFYESVLDFDPRPELERPNGVWDLGSPEAAEMAKLAETTYRNVNIALANQFARFAASRQIDIRHVIDACNSQPYSHLHTPGIAVGGHCIPVYPELYLWRDPGATVVEAAIKTNKAMPGYAVELLESSYGDLRGSTVVILGAAYRGGVKETAYSGVFPTRDALVERGASVVVHDPMFSAAELSDLGLSPYVAGQVVDAAIVQADHAEYRSLTPFDLPGIKVLLDGRRVTDGSRWGGVERLEI